MKSIITIFFFLILLFFFSGFEKKKVTDDDLLGEWIEESKTDTIWFTDNTNFYHSTKNMHYDHYDYTIKGDSMEIGYSGMMMILVPKTKHYFELKGDELMIDLSNKQCFGFSQEKMHYKRVKKIIAE